MVSGVLGFYPIRRQLGDSCTINILKLVARRKQAGGRESLLPSLMKGLKGEAIVYSQSPVSWAAAG